MSPNAPNVAMEQRYKGFWYICLKVVNEHFMLP